MHPRFGCKFAGLRMAQRKMFGVDVVGMSGTKASLERDYEFVDDGWG
jgi:hypothetical protein